MESAFSLVWYSFMVGEDSRLSGASRGPGQDLAQEGIDGLAFGLRTSSQPDQTALSK